MTSEEMQRTMEFLLAQQARFDARLEKLTDSQATLTASMLRIADFIEDLTQAQKRTDERLNALLSVVERHITGPDHGAKSS